jgi:pimeloyl-ACP methyl ester carboxylesterase
MLRAELDKNCGLTRRGMVADMKHIDYRLISKAFRHKADWNDAVPLAFPEEGADIFNLSFTSANAHLLLGQSEYYCQEHAQCFEGEPVKEEVGDCLIEENIRFRYPLVREHQAGAVPRRHDRLIVFLHGLNERSFSKYLPWAYHLWERAGVPVLLFPLTFHINRVLPDWAGRQQEIYERRSLIAGNESMHRFNAVISERLEAHPGRFFWGAVQSYLDLVDLTREIRSGRHAHFATDARVDVFGFSAGGYLSLLLLLADPEGLFTNSRGVVFASGVPVRDLNLSSPFIMDFAAEAALMKLYVKNIDGLSSARMQHWFEAHDEGRWMKAFSGLRADRTGLEERLKEISPRLLGISNVNDDVMPVGAMLNTLQGLRRDTNVRVAECELGVHESPFVCADYRQPDRRFVSEFLDEARYGRTFDDFIEEIALHLN